MDDLGDLLNKQRGPRFLDDIGPQFEDGEIVTRIRQRFSKLLLGLVELGALGYLYVQSRSDDHPGLLGLLLDVLLFGGSCAMVIMVLWAFFGRRRLSVDGRWLIRSKRLGPFKVWWDKTFVRDKLSDLKVDVRKKLSFSLGGRVLITIYVVTAWADGETQDLLAQLYRRDHADTVISLLKEKFGIAEKAPAPSQAFAWTDAPLPEDPKQG